MVLTVLDAAAFLWFLLCWIGYALVVDYSPLRHRSVVAAMDYYRQEWIRQCVRRDNRMPDVNILRSLQRSVQFYATTTMFVLAGLVAVLGSADKAMTLLREVEFLAPVGRLTLEVKLVVLLVMFIYAFFKFSWSNRLYNYTAVAIGAIPPAAECTEMPERAAGPAAELVCRATRHFTSGLRAYYFGLGLLSWFVHPLAFIAASALVVAVLFRREFRSGALRKMNER
ncbi:MAG: DUF599 domain-containing protein [Acetobacterales bacterium]